MKLFCNVLLLISLLIPQVTVAQVKSTTDPTQRMSDKDVKKNLNSVRLLPSEKAVEVYVGNSLFTRYDFSTYEKPIFYPVYGPAQVSMTRDFPMKNREGEANDHPHHKSIWLGHMFEGVDFWTEKGGVVKQVEMETVGEDADQFTVRNEWRGKKDSRLFCRQTSKFKFGASEKQRWIDAEFTFEASESDLVFDDTKEGLFAIRTHSDLRLNPDKKRGVEKVFGKALNSNGTGGKQIWGESAKWVYYWGPVDGKEVGIAFFDHPTNFRHPTTWHAREYGLVAANPFGLHYFKKQAKKAGQHTIKKGEQMTFRYRLLFASGTLSAEQVEKQFQTFANGE